MVNDRGGGGGGTDLCRTFAEQTDFRFGIYGICIVVDGDFVRASNPVANGVYATDGAGSGDRTGTTIGKTYPVGVAVDNHRVDTGSIGRFYFSKANRGRLATTWSRVLMDGNGRCAVIVVDTVIFWRDAGASGFFLDGLVIHYRELSAFGRSRIFGAGFESGREFHAELNFRLFRRIPAGAGRKLQ